jgi:long-chain acyl-CoA synthetase
LIFRKFKGLLGGKVRLIICGAAPIAPHILREFRCFFSCPVLEAYGMTETTGGGCMAFDVDPTPEGGVGAPNTECEVKLVSVPEMNYHADGKGRGEGGKVDPLRGEICFRGPCVTPGYFRAQELTKEAKSDDGWLHTGDVGELMANGGIKVIDRKKNIFKLAQGEYISAEKIEQTYLRAPAVGQVFLYGESTEVYPVAVVVVNDDWKKRFPELKGAELKDEVKKQMDQVAIDAKLLGFEKAKDIFIALEPFSVENDLLTPTMKIKRNDAKLRYVNELKAMYDALKKAQKN